MELQVDILQCLKQIEEENNGRSASKVSKIATMFQFPSENDDREEKDETAPQVTVVRTESHVARFNTARALFEKMAEKKSDDSKSSKGAHPHHHHHQQHHHHQHHPRRQCGGQHVVHSTARCTPSSGCGKASSRSPSPASSHSIHHQPNGHNSNSYKQSNPTSISTITSSYTPPPPAFHSSIQNPSIPSVLPLSVRSTLDAEVFKGKRHPVVTGEIPKSNVDLRNKIESSKYQHKEELHLSNRDHIGAGNKSFVNNGILNKFDDSNNDANNRKYDHSLERKEAKSRPNSLLKPEKPAKPETLIDKPLSSHLQNQQIIQRHKNWFQSYSKTKSPVTSPLKPTSNSFEQRTPEDDAPSVHSDWRRERSAILKGSGRNIHQEGEVKSSTDVNVKSFENVATLPSCWSPPKQYNESSVTTGDKEHHGKDSGYSSSAALSGVPEDFRKDPLASTDINEVECKTYIITDISKDARNREWKPTYSDVHDNKQIAGVFKKSNDLVGSSDGRPTTSTSNQNRSRVSEEENNVVLRHRDDLPVDKELRLKEWEKRLSQRDSFLEGKSERNFAESSPSSSLGRMERNHLRDSQNERKDRKKMEEEYESRKRTDMEKNRSEEIRKTDENALQQRLHNEEDRETRKMKLQMEKERINKDAERRLRKEEIQRNKDEYIEIERKDERERPERVKIEREVLRGKDERMDKEEREKLRRDNENLRFEKEGRHSLRREHERKRLEKEEIEKERLKREEQAKERIRQAEEQERRNREEERRERLRWEKEERERLKIEAEEKERLRKEAEKRERLKKEEENREKLRKEEERERLKREEEERERIRKEKERIQREEEEREKLIKERLRKEEEAREILRREKEEQERLRKEEERERIRREEEERERMRRAEEEKERMRREEEERERLRREKEEWERVKREEEERERIRKEKEERERIRKEEERERIRREEEEERIKREEQKERMRREEEERERQRREIEERERQRREIEERERLRREEEMERIRIEKEEKERIRREKEERERLRRVEEERERLRKEEEERERIRREEEENERLRMEEEEKRKKERERIRREEEAKEKQRLKMEEEERIRKENEERERLRKEEREHIRREAEEKERIKREEEERELLRMEEKKKLKREEEERERLKEAQEKDINYQKEELERKWQAKRDKLEEEERIRKEKDRLEIEKTKRRIAELKKERDEIQRQQAHRLRMLMTENTTDDADKAVEAWQEIPPDEEEVEVTYPKRSLPTPHTEQDSIISKDEIRIIAESQTPTVIITLIDDDIDQESNDDTDEGQETNEITDCGQKTNNEIDLGKETFDYADLDQETNAKRVEEAFSSRRDSNISNEQTIEGFEENFEDIAYDHTVLSAQHKLQFCTSSYNDSISKDSEEKKDVSHPDHFSSSTLSSEFEPLPPPVPPHNVDPATLTSSVCIDQQRLPSLPNEAELPEPMTPEEAEKLLSHNIIETKKGLLADTGEQEFLKSSNAQQSYSPTEENNRDEINVSTTKIEQDDAFDKDYDSVCVDSPTPDNEEEGEEPYTYFKHQMNDEGFVIRAKEVLNEDGIHYLEDGHFWIQVPGLTEDDEDELPETVPVHKHTKLKFSKDPIKLFSTFSVTDYDRRNDDVDPVAASAEYELEKRVEKMNVFPVCIEKGEGGLGLSIIGMGVGADAGVEKLGIFVKTITPGGATANDARIQVNDQIIEVDNQSLVGVTQMFAASVLKNTSGTVNFLIGRENDPENSEVAMLIRQSLMADQERDERRRALEGPNYDPRNSTGIFESFSSQSGGESPSEEAPRNNYVPTHQEHLYGQEYVDQYGDVYGSCPSSPPEGISSPPPEAYNHDVEGRELLLQNNEIIIMSQHLQEIQHRNDMYEEEITILRNKICDLEKELGSTTDMSRRIQETTVKLKELEDTLQSRQTEISTYQDMLEQSQGQYIILEKKYYKAKKIIKEYQSRERDFLHREEYHITQLEEKDALYNSLVKALKDRVIQLEGDLIKAQQEAGLPVKIPPDLNSQSSNFVQSKEQDNHSSIQRDPPRKPASINTLDADLSDNEGGDTHTSEGSKSSTVERKIPSKEELDVAVPPTELLDNSFSKAKGELASRGGLANRQLPSLKKSSSNASANSFEHSFDDIVDDSLPESQQQQQHQLTPSSTVQSRSTSSSTFHSEESSIHSSSSTPTTSNAPNSHSQGNVVYGNRTQPPPPYQATHTQTSTHPTSPQHQPPPYQPPPSAPLSYRPGISSDAQSGRHPPPVARVQPVNRVEAVNSPLSLNNQQHQQTLAHQLKALLAEREGNPEAMQEGSNSCMKKSPSSLMEDVRRANIQADMSIGKKPVISGPIHVSSTAQVVSTGQFVHSRTSPQKSSSVGSFQQKINRDSGSWSPVINSSNSPGSVVLLSQRPIDSSLPMTPTSETGDMSTKHSMVSLDSTSSFDSQTHERFPSGRPPKEITPVIDWTKEQVAQWLVVQGLENYVSTFVSAGITGPRLINIDTKDLKNLGLSSDDKTKIKRKVKELRQNVEKEKKQREKESKEREKLQRKAEKLAEKAERRKK